MMNRSSPRRPRTSSPVTPTTSSNSSRSESSKSRLSSFCARATSWPVSSSSVRMRCPFFVVLTSSTSPMTALVPPPLSRSVIRTALRTSRRFVSSRRIRLYRSRKSFVKSSIVPSHVLSPVMSSSILTCSAAWWASWRSPATDAPAAGGEEVAGVCEGDEERPEGPEAPAVDDVAEAGVSALGKPPAVLESEDAEPPVSGSGVLAAGVDCEEASSGSGSGSLVAGWPPGADAPLGPVAVGSASSPAGRGESGGASRGEGLEASEGAVGSMDSV